MIRLKEIDFHVFFRQIYDIFFNMQINGEEECSLQAEGGTKENCDEHYSSELALFFLIFFYTYNKLVFFRLGVRSKLLPFYLTGAGGGIFLRQQVIFTLKKGFGLPKYFFNVPTERAEILRVRWVVAELGRA